MRFEGASWLINDIREFGGPALELISDANDGTALYGLAVEGFGGPTWFDETGTPSASRYLESIPHSNRERISNGFEILIFDMSNEGPGFRPDWMSILHNSLSQYSIPISKCVLLQQNRRFEGYYQEWASSCGILSIKTMVYDHYPRRMSGILSNQEMSLYINSSIRSKMFLCLNFTPRDPRVGMVSWLLAKSFDRLGRISFSNFEASKQDLGAPSIPNWFPEIEIALQGFEMLKIRVPMTLDLDPKNASVPEYDVGTNDMYFDTYFSIVTESELSSGEIVRVTEKVIKPLAMMHPIIIFGNPYSLRLLKSFGFKTFSDILDESYDEIEDPAARAAAAIKEIERLLALSYEELHKAYHSIRGILLHNAIIARRHLNDYYTHVWSPILLDEILSAV